jgi:glycosyltransferase involved in cell wall biosynthesis
MFDYSAGRFPAPQSLGAAERTDIPVIVHCHLRWDFVWQRPQHIFSRLAAHHPVLFIEEPLCERGEPRLRISQPAPGLVRVVPILPPREDAGVDADCRLILPMLEQALRAHALIAGRFDRPVQWFYSPMTAPAFLGCFNSACVVYDCMDELANFRFAPPDIGERERVLLAAADVVFTGGYQLFAAKSRVHSNVHFHGCGVDLDHFGRARDSRTVVPNELSALPRPVLGYFGVIDERLDYGLLKHLAESFPEGSIAMVGPLAKVAPEDLPRLPNLHWLGQRTYAQLPEMVKGFDVCLMPFALNDSTRFINPTKTLEYMAAGKPIVSTAIPDVIRNFTPVVAVAHDAVEFVRHVKRLLEARDEALIQRGIEVAAGSSWDAIVLQMRSRMLEALQSSAIRSAGTMAAS